VSGDADIKLLTAGQTTELMSRLLGAALHKLGGVLSVSTAELRELDGMQLEHGTAPDGSFVVRLAPNAAEVERQALEATPDTTH